MAEQPQLWIRHEVRASERRAPLVPQDARRLVELGFRLTVEESPQRVFPLEEYLAAGCTAAPAGSWTTAPEQSYVLGLKELPEHPEQLTHRHIFFGHAYKGQQGSRELLARFCRGGGELLDLEYLVDDAGRRLAAFGYWAGYVGAALGVLQARGRLTAPLRPLAKAELDDQLRHSMREGSPDALVIGALGRCGRGAVDALEVAGLAATCWDVAETRALDRTALLHHDLLVNTVLTTRPIPPFLRPTDLEERGRRLALVVDVTCDVTSDLNVLPVYRTVTEWADPVRRLHQDPPLDLIAIDNLPSLLPAEASRAFSAELVGPLRTLADPDSPWRHCRADFETACRAHHLEAVHV
ncbi:saccharopine dehydrogenase [Streptomyces tateyamensis]|uniref:Saccharopine dehydrogenase [NAD(+), L-lysine-forming] n=1 Tax=Streptomyces tateyamensis TaxID=565073 RepID=A0A2V4MZQ0_9ACTN|nr:saccharopine dehydrogenase [Streptomyces tateyamensis]PYC71896.1 saccharopine dehydrogenase [Streptomyces tateyamensis]